MTRYCTMSDAFPAFCFNSQIVSKIMYLCSLLFIFNFGHYKLHFSSITLHVRVAIKSWYLFMVSANPFTANKNTSVSTVLSIYSITFSGWESYSVLLLCSRDFVDGIKLWYESIVPIFFRVTPLLSQWTHPVTIASLLRQDDVATSFWRNNDVIIASRVHGLG